MTDARFTLEGPGVPSSSTPLLSVALVVVVSTLAMTPSPASAQSADSIVNRVLWLSDDAGDEETRFGPKLLDLRSQGRQKLERVQREGRAPRASSARGERKSGRDSDDSRHDRDAENVLASNPADDHIVTAPGAFPLEPSNQSETSMAVHGRHIVVAYNGEARTTPWEWASAISAWGTAELLISGFSTSHDGGRTWSSGHVPPAPGASFTFGDPTVRVDRRGNFYYASLGVDENVTGAVIVNKSVTHGESWAPAVIAAVDDGVDFTQMEIGPDPRDMKRDVIYVTWTSLFRPDSGFCSPIWLARSTDGGATWTSKEILSQPRTDVLSCTLVGAKPVVDKATGRLYVPLVHLSVIDTDFVRVLTSDDGGDTFQLLRFDIPGAPDAFAYPFVSAGHAADCGTSGGLRLVLHQGPDVGGGRFGLPRWVHATRLGGGPTAAAFGGSLFITLDVSTSPFWGDPGSGSEIVLLYSRDGGRSWEPRLTVAPSTRAMPLHVNPTIALGDEGERVFVAYYAQQDDSRLRTEVASIRTRGHHLRTEKVEALSNVAFDLTPTNIPVPTARNPFRTANYDRVSAPCYGIGEYMAIQAMDHGELVGAWGDNRRTWIGPPDSAAPGPHAQTDVFFKGSERSRDED